MTSRALDCTARNYEISFEAGFMQEHDEAFKKQTRNFMESCFKPEIGEKVTFNSSSFFGDEEPEYTTYDQEDDGFYRFPEIKPFLKECENQEKLIQFFDLIFHEVPRAVAIELIFLGACSWREFSKPVPFFVFSPQAIINKAKTIAENECHSKFGDERIKFLNLSTVCQSELAGKEEIIDAFQRYFEFLTATIFFLREEYFDNPYRIVEESKRRRNHQHEEEIELIEHESMDSLFGGSLKKIH